MQRIDDARLDAPTRVCWTLFPDVPDVKICHLRHHQYLTHFYFVSRRSSSQPEPCSGLWTVWNLRVLQQKKHSHWVSNHLLHSFTYFYHHFSNISHVTSPTCLPSLLLSINNNRRVPWHVCQYIRERRRVPRERPTVSLPRQQSHALPCAWREGAMGGTSHTLNHQLLVLGASQHAVWV